MVSQEQVGKAIIRLRKLRGLSQERFALEAGIDRRYLSDVENGKRNVSLDLLNRVAGFFKIPLSSFFEEVELSFPFKDLHDLRLFLQDHDNENTVFLTSPDYLDAIIGFSQDGRLIYSYDRMIEYLILKDNMSYDEAVEFIDYNTIRAIPYMGEFSPIINYSISY